MPAARPEDVAKLYLSMKYKSNPEPELGTLSPPAPPSKEEEVPPQQQQYYHQQQQYFHQQQQQQFNQQHQFGSFQPIQQPPPLPPTNVYSQHPVVYRHNSPFNPPPAHPPPQGALNSHHRMMQPPIGDNFRMHPQAQQPPLFGFGPNHLPPPMGMQPSFEFSPFQRPPNGNMMSPIRGMNCIICKQAINCVCHYNIK